MSKKEKNPANTKHGHPDNKFHTVEKPGFSTSFYLSGEEQQTLAASLGKQATYGMTPEQIKAALSAQARTWFHEMMEAKKNEFS